MIPPPAAQSPVGRVVGQLRTRLLSAVPNNIIASQHPPSPTTRRDAETELPQSHRTMAPLRRRGPALSPGDIAARDRHRQFLQQAVHSATCLGIDTDAGRTVLSLIRQAAAIDERLEESVELVKRMNHLAAIGSATLLPPPADDTGDGGEEEDTMAVVSSPVPLTLDAIERRSGILGRLHSQRQRRVQARRLLASDFQFSEVLPSGRVVALTHCTLPSQVASLATDSATALLDQCIRSSSVRQRAMHTAVGSSPLASLSIASEDASEELKPPAEASPSAAAAAAARDVDVYLHVVLHKCGVSLSDAVAAIVASSDAGLRRCSAGDIAVNVMLDEQSATTQTCSIRVGTLGSLLDDGDPSTTQQLERLFACNLSATSLRLQWLGLRSFPCSLNVGSSCRVRCTAMLRGIHARPSAVRAAAKRALRLAPNFFGPRRFYGSPTQRFWHYHVAEALGRGMYRGALAMLTHNAAGAASSQKRNDDVGGRGGVVLHNNRRGSDDDVARCAGASAGGAAWVEPFFKLMREGEDREAAYREVYERNVPRMLRRMIDTSRECLAFNALLSVRVRTLSTPSTPSQLLRAEDGGTAEDEEPGDVYQDQDNGIMHPSGGLRVGDLVATPQNSSVAPITDNVTSDDGGGVVVPSASDDIGPTLDALAKAFQASAAAAEKAHTPPAEVDEPDDGRTTSHHAVRRRGEGDQGLKSDNPVADAFPSIPSGMEFDTKWEELLVPASSATLSARDTLSDDAAGGAVEADRETAEVALDHIDVVRTPDDGMLRSVEGLLLPLRALSPGMAKLWGALGLQLNANDAAPLATTDTHKKDTTTHRGTKKRRGRKQARHHLKAEGGDGNIVGDSDTQTPPPQLGDHGRCRPVFRHAFVGADIGRIPATQYRHHHRPDHRRRVQRRAAQSHLYVRSISEIAEVPYAPIARGRGHTDEGVGDADATTVLRLATDAELTGAAKQQFASLSRGTRLPLWPIGRVGHRLSDRLPVGALADASDRGVAGGGKALVLLFEVPASAYVSAVFREFVTIKQQPRTLAIGATANATAASRRPPAAAPTRQQPTAVSEQIERVADGNILRLSVRGGMSIHEAVRKGYKTDALATGRSVPRHLVDESSEDHP